jgi:isoleucyl-tRNA synthetase
VHLADFPVPDTTFIDTALEQRMDYAQRISSLVLSIRKKEGHRVRQPLTKILLPILDPEFINQVEAVKELILSEVNVKQIEYITDTDGFITKKAKANFKTLGKVLGKSMKAGAEAISEMSQQQIASLEKTGTFLLQLDSEKFELTTEDVEISFDEIPGWQVAVDRDITVALDITLNESLIAEGIARELVNRIQNIRKTRDFAVTDRILVEIQHHETILEAVNLFGEYIQNEVLANGIQLSEATDGELVEITEDLFLRIAVKKAQ